MKKPTPEYIKFPRASRKHGEVKLPSGVVPEKEELETAQIFTKLGYDVKFVKPNRTPGARNADVEIAGVVYEIKCPDGNGKRTIEKQFHRASKQSRNLILNSNYSKMEYEKFYRDTQREISKRRNLGKILLINRGEKVLDLRK